MEIKFPLAWVDEKLTLGSPDICKMNGYVVMHFGAIHNDTQALFFLQVHLLPLTPTEVRQASNLRFPCLLDRQSSLREKMDVVTFLKDRPTYDSANRSQEQLLACTVTPVSLLLFEFPSSEVRNAA